MLVFVPEARTCLCPWTDAEPEAVQYNVNLSDY